MNWMFWKKDGKGDPINKSEEKLPRPKDILSVVGMNLVTAFNRNPDWVWNLKTATMVKPDDRNVTLYRVFDPAQAGSAKVSVKNYKTLDSHPELILYEGWMNKKNKQFEIKDLKEKVEEIKAA